MQTRRFIQCDVFKPIPTPGNVMAVVLDGDGLSEASKREFAAWTNLAEITFNRRDGFFMKRDLL